MDLEKKGKQSYQGYVFARFLGFSNGSLQALYDKSDGFYRRQLVLTTLDKKKNRKDDPCLAAKLTGWKIDIKSESQILGMEDMEDEYGNPIAAQTQNYDVFEPFIAGDIGNEDDTL